MAIDDIDARLRSGRRYTEEEKEPLERAGYFFKDATCLTDPVPMFVVAHYAAKHREQNFERKISIVEGSWRDTNVHGW